MAPETDQDFLIIVRIMNHGARMEIFPEDDLYFIKSAVERWSEHCEKASIKLPASHEDWAMTLRRWRGDRPFPDVGPAKVELWPTDSVYPLIDLKKAVSSLFQGDYQDATPYSVKGVSDIRSNVFMNLTKLTNEVERELSRTVLRGWEQGKISGMVTLFQNYQMQTTSQEAKYPDITPALQGLRDTASMILYLTADFCSRFAPFGNDPDPWTLTILYHGSQPREVERAFKGMAER